MFVHKVGMDQMNRALVVLQDADRRRLLPIWIGPFEAQAIALAVSNASHERPFTHDLLHNVISELGQHVERIEVTRLENNTFFAEIVLSDGGATHVIDSRPSDAIALAVRAHAPIFVAPEVLDQAEYPTEEAEAEDLATFKRLLSGIDSESPAGESSSGQGPEKRHPGAEPEDTETPGGGEETS